MKPVIGKTFTQKQLEEMVLHHLKVTNPANWKRMTVELIKDDNGETIAVTRTEYEEGAAVPGADIVNS